MTLQEILVAKLQTAKDEVSKLEADLQNLASSGWLAQEEAQLKIWFAAVKQHLGL
jgi:hypothetical protein